MGYKLRCHYKYDPNLCFGEPLLRHAISAVVSIFLYLRKPMVLADNFCIPGVYRGWPSDRFVYVDKQDDCGA